MAGFPEIVVRVPLPVCCVLVFLQTLQGVHRCSARLRRCMFFFLLFLRKLDGLVRRVCQCGALCGCTNALVCVAKKWFSDAPDSCLRLKKALVELQECCVKAVRKRYETYAGIEELMKAF